MSNEEIDKQLKAVGKEWQRLLIADNDKDFKRVPELKYVNPNAID
jgi:hypothetical protein